MIKYAIIPTDDQIIVEEALPSNYRIIGRTFNTFTICGEDQIGITLADFILPVFSDSNNRYPHPAVEYSEADILIYTERGDWIPVEEFRYGLVLEDSYYKAERYLPRAFKLYGKVDTPEGKMIVISGFNNHGWTLEGYVIPRYMSGMIFCRELLIEELDSMKRLGRFEYFDSSIPLTPPT